VTAIHDIARRIVLRNRQEDRPTVLLHFGDYDPSGESIFDTIRDDAGLFVAQYSGDWDLMRPERIALTGDQVDEYSLETAPPKLSDSRSANWYGETAQLEAMPPDLLAEVVREAIESRMDLDALEAVRDRSEEERGRLTEWLEDLS